MHTKRAYSRTIKGITVIGIKDLHDPNFIGHLLFNGAIFEPTSKSEAIKMVKQFNVNARNGCADSRFSVSQVDVRHALETYHPLSTRKL